MANPTSTDSVNFAAAIKRLDEQAIAERKDRDRRLLAEMASRIAAGLAHEILADIDCSDDRSTRMRESVSWTAVSIAASILAEIDKRGGR